MDALTKHEAPKVSLRVARVRAGLSQASLAGLTGAHRNTIALAEQQGRVSPALAKKIAPVLGCTAEELAS